MAGGQVISVAGEVLTAARVNTYWMDQAIMKVTSGTRPSAAAQGGGLLAGMFIFETDTYKLQQYTTATTLWTPPWNLPWGLVDLVQTVTTTQTGITALTDITSLASTITYLANRRIKITAAGLVVTTAGTPAYADLKIRESSTELTYDRRLAPPATGISLRAEHALTPSAGSHTYKVSAGPASGTISFLHIDGNNRLSYLRIEDMGPSANPS